MSVLVLPKLRCACRKQLLLDGIDAVVAAMVVARIQHTDTRTRTNNTRARILSVSLTLAPTCRHLHLLAHTIAHTHALMY